LVVEQNPVIGRKKGDFAGGHLFQPGCAYFRRLSGNDKSAGGNLIIPA
jgi:hypothetical protein